MACSSCSRPWHVGRPGLCRPTTSDAVCSRCRAIPDGPRDRELEFVAGEIQRAPRNEAAWNYLTGLFAALQPWASQQRALSRCLEVGRRHAAVRVCID